MPWHHPHPLASSPSHPLDGCWAILALEAGSCIASLGSGTRRVLSSLPASHLRAAWLGAKPAVLSRRLPAFLFFLPGR